MAVLPPPGLRFPDFLCIGAQKAGTTWLDANLRRHPGIWMPWIKELQYFNDVHIPAHRAWTGRHRLAHGAKAAARVQRWAEAAGAGGDAVDRIQAMWGEPVSDDWYGRIFAHARPDQLCGEVTPEYSLLPPEGIEHVKRLNPRMKIIFLMRDPVERCWSHLRMLGQGREDFDYLAAARNPEVLARADYGRIVRDWTALFGEAHVRTAWIEDVAKAPEVFLQQVVGFLGLAWDARVGARAAEPVFVGNEVEMPNAVRDALYFKTRSLQQQSMNFKHPVATRGTVGIDLH
jgi:hypothetical protein